MHIKINEYDYIAWDEYQGKPQLTVYYRTKAGEFKPKFIKQEFGRNNWKDVPLRITFDSKIEVEAVLSAELCRFDEADETPDDDVPF